MGLFKSVAIDEIERRRSIKDVDVLRFRRAWYADGRISAEEAETLFRLNDTCPVQDPAWPEFFIEAATDYIVEQAEPEGYLTVENAEWLVARISADGRVETRTELDLLIAVIDKARWVPERLVGFALAQIRDAVVAGTGAARTGKSHRAGVVDAADVDMLRRILFAYGGDGGIAISRCEAEILFDINDATADAENDPAWGELFVKAIANAVMTASGCRAPSRTAALAADAEKIRIEETGIGRVLKGMASGGFGGFGALYRAQSSEEAAIARLERQKIEIITHERVTEAEAGWLAERIGRDMRMTPNESALLAYLKAESASVHPALREMVERAVRAA